MARVLVTGGTGFIGRNLVERLLQQGDQVRCLIQDVSRQIDLGSADVEAHVGDIRVPDSLHGAVQGVEVVYHLAGATLVLRPAEYHPINAEGTRNLALACCRQSPPPTFVYVSSLAAAGPSSTGEPLTESALPAPVSAYGRSKLAAERYLMELALQLPITVLRPPAVFGPHDPHTYLLFRSARAGILLIAGRQTVRLAWLHVSDLVDALILAANRGVRLDPAAESGRGIYFVAMDEQPTTAEAARLAAEAWGRKPWCVVKVPALLCRMQARMADWIARMRGRPFLLTSDKMTEALAGSWLCDSGKAKSELGLACRIGMAEGFRALAAWYRDQGWL